jgi:Chromo (CHRromatin Organisation MOdifier) domain
MVRQRAVCANKSIHKRKKTCFSKLLPARLAESQAMCKDMFDRSMREKSKEFQVQSCIEPRKYVHTGEPEQEAKFLLERIVGARQMSDGKLLYLIRWYGYGRDDDTWLPVEYLPKRIVRRYHRRTHIPYPQ